MPSSPSTRLVPLPKPILAAAIACCVTAPMPAALDEARTPGQTPPIRADAGLPGSIRPSTRTAANRTWFQIGTLVATNNNPVAAPGSTLDVMAANGVTLRELMGFAYL